MRNVLIPVVDKGIDFLSIPSHVSVFYTIGNCKCHCRGCHSEYLWDTNEQPAGMTLDEMIEFAEKQIDEGANAIVLMGGTNNGIPDDIFVKVVRELSLIAPLCVYSGLPKDAPIHDRLLKETMITWLKTGEYDESKGGLNTRGTNQRFYRKDIRICCDRHEGVIETVPFLIDETWRFNNGKT